MSNGDNEVKFEALAGKILVKIEGLENGSESVRLKCSDGSEYVMYHSQDCCESVQVEDIVGDVADLLDSPIVRAEEVSGETSPDGWKLDYTPESFTWTFYKIDTQKGGVTIRWLGTSNGYYSESVSFRIDVQPLNGSKHT